MSSPQTTWIIVHHGPKGQMIVRDDRGRRLGDVEDRSTVTSFIGRVAEALKADASLPVFTSVPDPERLRAFLALASGASLVQPVRLGRLNWRRRGPLTLPVDIVGVGFESAAAIERIAGSDWLKGAPNLATAKPGRVDPALLREALRSATRDVILTGTKEARRALAEAGRLPVQRRPRLVLAISGPSDQRSRWLDDLEPPHGIAVAYARPAGADDGAAFATRVLEQIAEDVPIHEAVRRAADSVGPDALKAPPEVIADPGTNEALSLEPPRIQLLDRAQTVLGRLADAERRDPWLAVGDPSARLTSLVHPTARGLTSLAELADAIACAEVESHNAEATPTSEKPGRVRARLPTDRPSQTRRVDLTVRANRRSVETALTPGQRVRILLRIGLPFADSRLLEKAPPIAGSLPAADADGGHDLDVVIYGLDFRVEGRRTSHRLRLPVTGRTELVSIPVFAPTKPLRGARLRVAIYCRAHLVQSFLMTADVDERREGAPPQFALEFAQSVHFANLDALPRRRASIAVNAAANGSHTLMLKGPVQAQQPRPVSLSDSHVTAAITNFRATLTEVYRSVTKDRSPPSADPDHPNDFAGEWRRLAELGQEIYRELRLRFPEEDRKLLDTLKSTTDEVLQIVRLDPSFSYPWTMLYDWTLPTVITGDEPPAVCFGVVGAGETERPCDHGPDSDAYCVNGFWAVRLRLEQLVSNAGDADVPGPLTGNHPVRLGLGVGHDAGTDGLAERLGALMPTGTVERFAAATLDDLWDPGWRPAQLIAIGHHTDAPVVGEPQGARIRLDDSWLLLSKLGERLDKGCWEMPNSIVLLLACETNATTPATLNDFSAGFLQARAGGVIATEIPIRTDLASRCAEMMTRALFVEHHDYSTAVRELHRQLARRGNPLAFSFVNLGHAELHVAP